MADHLPANPYPSEPVVRAGDLPDLFLAKDGGRIASAADWPACAARWKALIVEQEYGGMPPAPTSVTAELHCQNVRRSWPGKPQYWSFRIHSQGGSRPFHFELKLLIPTCAEPVPVIINGDACWWRSEEVAQEVLASGNAIAYFDRTELAKDLLSGQPGRDDRSGGLYDVYPGHTFGALAAWAWGYQRCVDVLEKLPFINSRRIAVSGHSRGGKTVLLAGLVDERIALINDNASCAGGGAAFRYVGHGGETIGITRAFPSWFAPGLHAFIGREDLLPFDQHCLLASLAPRPLLLTYALDDRWSNPEGMVQCAWAAREAYRLVQAPDALAFHLRPGGHAQGLDDWRILLDFIDWQWQGRSPRSAFNRHPYTHLRPAFAWAAPG